MRLWDKKIVTQVQALRSQGYSYSRINQTLKVKVPKSTLSTMCKGIDPGDDYRERLKKEHNERLVYFRTLAVKRNKQLLEVRFDRIRSKATFASMYQDDKEVAKIALAMLYLGEGAKYPSHRGLALGNSDPRIVRLYIRLLDYCYQIPLTSLRARIQSRADQDQTRLLNFWARTTGIKKEHFYPSNLDKRTIGKVTKKTEYKGVCNITGGSADIQLELQYIADIIVKTWGISSFG